MLLRHTLLTQLLCASTVLQKTAPPFMSLQLRYAGGAKTGGLPRARFIPSPRFTGLRPASPRRPNFKKCVQLAPNTVSCRTGPILHIPERNQLFCSHGERFVMLWYGQGCGGALAEAVS